MRMESNVLATVLTSSVVAGVISSLVAYFQFHKNNKLVYITNERKAWRSDIRRIAEEIEAATGYEDIRKPLVELKVRINAYGKNTDDVKKDSHIWKVIERLQKQNDDFDEAKQLLILYLSTLLKMDWERSKEEIKGNTYKIVLYFVTLATEIVYCYIYLVELKISSNLMFIGSIIIMMLPIILPERSGINLDDAIEWVKGKENIFFHKFIKTMCICLLLFIGSILLECLFDSILMKWTEFWLPMVLLFVGFTIRYLYEYRKYLLDIYYIQTNTIYADNTKLNPDDMESILNDISSVGKAWESMEFQSQEISEIMQLPRKNSNFYKGIEASINELSNASKV